MASGILYLERCPQDPQILPTGTERYCCADRPDTIQEALQGTSGPIQVIPLMLSDHCTAYRMMRGILADRPDAVLTAALGESPELIEAIIARAKEILREPYKECLVLVARGPEDAGDNKAWLVILDRIATEVEKRMGLGLVKISSLMQDAPGALHRDAVEKLRTMVERESGRFRVVVLAVEFVPGGVERILPEVLHGIPCDISDQVLLPSEALERWVRRSMESTSGWT